MQSLQYVLSISSIILAIFGNAEASSQFDEFIVKKQAIKVPLVRLVQATLVIDQVIRACSKIALSTPKENADNISNMYVSLNYKIYQVRNFYFKDPHKALPKNMNFINYIINNNLSKLSS